MIRLVLCQGLPGSGKTTMARRWVEENPDRRVRLNRDDFRRMLHGRHLGTAAQEQQVSIVQHAAIRAALTAGYDVIVDDTNLDERTVQTLTLIGQHAAAVVTFVDLRHVPLQVCLDRNKLRAGTDAHVPPEKIRDMHRRHIAPPEERP